MSPGVGLADVLFGSWNLENTDAFMSYWVQTSHKITVVYLLTIYLGQKFMRDKEPLELDGTLATWNFVFSLFSGVAAYKLIPELLDTFLKKWFRWRKVVPGTYCNNNEFYTDASTGFWGWLFVMSKAFELGDTIFLILRKKPVIFMHWYHHALTFTYATITYSEHQAWARWSLTLNLVVHTIMYFYFGVRALKFNTPRTVAKFITTIQIVQFVISCYIFAHLLIIKMYDQVPNCAVSWNVLSVGGVMYLSYLFLFAEFFYKAYIKQRSPTKIKLQ
ncbi:GNS1/SUR4 family protein [Dictyocaulus viviparus]|uniref:Elongation of very long chain fatty acids protein n=1 Tax=Dictyocaulus viviparus TaxID=29172 RepID=A0A0D8XGH9_DICVI|nr:GNS1/SUR4 family protein [Dictyocaulus viviparus]